MSTASVKTKQNYTLCIYTGFTVSWPYTVPLMQHCTAFFMENRGWMRHKGSTSAILGPKQEEALFSPVKIPGIGQIHVQTYPEKKTNISNGYRERYEPMSKSSFFVHLKCHLFTWRRKQFPLHQEVTRLADWFTLPLVQQSDQSLNVKLVAVVFKRSQAVGSSYYYFDYY